MAYPVDDDPILICRSEHTLDRLQRRNDVLATLCGLASPSTAARVHAAATRVQCVARGRRLRRDKVACDLATTRLLRHARGFLQRRRFLAQRRACVLVQRGVRRVPRWTESTQPPLVSVDVVREALVRLLRAREEIVELELLVLRLVDLASCSSPPYDPSGERARR